MKKLLLPLLLSFLIIGCENNITGTDGNYSRGGYLEDVSFTAVEYDLGYGNWWRVKGLIINTGDESIRRNWFISADFFTDSTFSKYCSHTYTTMVVKLNPGDTTNWSITTPGGDCIYDKDDYPNFAVTNIRAYK